MTRIATSMINNSALTDLQRAQRDLFEAQRKTASQKESDDLKGYGRDARSVVNLERMRAKSEAFKSSAEELTTRLELQDTYLGRVTDVTADLKEKLTTALSLGDMASVNGELTSAFADIKSAFNASLNGKYLFGGTASHEPPITAGNVDDLSDVPLTNSISADGDIVQIQIDENRKVNAGPLARTEAVGILTVLRDLKVFNDVNEPFTDTPSQAQKDAVAQAISALGTVHNDLLTTQAQNGQVLNQTDAVIERHTTEADLMESLTADITEVDLAEVAVQLNQAQLQFQATASVFRTIQGLSLVDFLR
ncbi:MAG: hypothetical protein CMK09_09830 [Ponticaulis sp.]|nr:hypothetical protein [Ponticaulis sp.]|tara:strand:- start:17181 stop:18101 length:921 start_codon:yes stop_codon:yes gene_type:complete